MRQGRGTHKQHAAVGDDGAAEAGDGSQHGAEDGHAVHQLHHAQTAEQQQHVQHQRVARWERPARTQLTP